MNIHVRSDTGLTIDSVLRPIMSARKVLKDYDAYRCTVVGRTRDDPPGLVSIGRAADGVRQALAASVTEEAAKLLVEEMLGGLNLSAAVVDGLTAAVVLDGSLPIAAAAMAAAKYRGRQPSPEQFLTACMQARQSIAWLIESLIDARNAMQRRQTVRV
jgi:hypothetical protein